MDNEQFEDLCFVKKAFLDQIPVLLFRNQKCEIRIVEALKYDSLELTPGTIMRARARRRGCAGSEITDLLHPKYTNGETYLFRIVSIGTVSLEGSVLHFVTVSDDHGGEHRIRVPDNKVFKVGEQIACRLESQLQGRLRFIYVKE